MCLYRRGLVWFGSVVLLYEVVFIYVVSLAYFAINDEFSFLCFLLYILPNLGVDGVITELNLLGGVFIV